MHTHKRRGLNGPLFLFYDIPNYLLVNNHLQMKKSQLQSIIKEELRNVLKEVDMNAQIEQRLANVFSGMGLGVTRVDANMSSGITPANANVYFKQTFDQANKNDIINDYNDNREMSDPEIIAADVLGPNQVKFYFKGAKGGTLKEEYGPTDFEFDAKSLASGNVNVEVDGQYIYGRKVGDEFVYTSKVDPNWADMKVARFREHNGPNNYMIFLHLTAMPDSPNYKADVKAIAKALNSKFEWYGGESSSTGKISNGFSAYRLSADEAKKTIQKFVIYLNKTAPKTEGLVGNIKAGVKSLAGSTEVKPNDKIKIEFDKELKSSTNSMTELEFKMVSTSYGPKDETFMYMKWPNEYGGNYSATLRNDGQLKVGDIPAIGSATSGDTPAEQQNVKVKRISVNGKDVKSIHWKEIKPR